MRNKYLLALTAMALVVAACTDSNGGDTATTEAGTTETTEAAPAAGQSVLDQVLENGSLSCGVGSVPGFSAVTADGDDVGFDVDFCRAVAAAVLGDAEAVTFRTGIPGTERIEVVTSGQIDLLSRTTTQTQSRMDSGVEYAPIVFYDGQKMMGRASDGITADSPLTAMDGGTVCVATGTTTELNLLEAANGAGISVETVTTENRDQAIEQFTAGACDFFTSDASANASFKAALDTEDDWVIFPGSAFSKEPLAPVYIANDRRWGNVIDWVVNALIIFEEAGVTAANADDMAANPPTPGVGRLLGGEGEIQTAMGLSADAFLTMVKATGNYGEIYDRNLTPIGLARPGTSNDLWLNGAGGLLYAPPAR
ncbi:MAG: transporter substrate-binding domain-containing protein [Actinomycetota bacterium]|nr:transporter substrate-binding domain-containing protein [Actinomycetota bacterium]